MSRPHRPGVSFSLGAAVGPAGGLIPETRCNGEKPCLSPGAGFAPSTSADAI